MKKCFASFGLVLLFASVAYSSTTTPLFSSREYTVGQGDIETSFFMSPRFQKVGGFSSDSFVFRSGLNYFMSDILAPGVDFGFGSNFFHLIPNVKAYIPTNSRFLPFMQAGLGFSRQFEQNYLAVVLSPGVNYMLSNTVAIGGQLRYELGAGSTNYHLFEVPIQFAIYFRY